MKRSLVLATLLFACTEQKTERPADEKVALGGDVVARVAGTPIPVSLVATVANAQKITAAEAARRVIDDEIAASAARAKGLDQRDPAAWNLSSARARLVADRIYAEAVQQGPPTDDEVRVLSQRYWAEVDRPPTMKVVHALVFHPKDHSELEPEARALATQIHDAVAGATSEADFEARAKAVPHEARLETRIEGISPFAADGYLVDGGRLDETFTVAADKLSVGATSPVVETPFGYHVIRMVERYPAMQMPLEERRIAFREEAYALRGRKAMGSVMSDLQKRHHVQVLPTAESLMRSVSIAREPQASLP